MSDHLPECIYAPRNVDPDKGIEWGGSPCICAALRACEQRVFQEQIEGRQHDIVLAYLRGLDAARDAVAAWNCGWPDDHSQHTGCPCAEQALAAIDALRADTP